MKKYILFFVLASISAINCMDEKELADQLLNANTCDEIQKLIDLGVDIDSQDENGYTKLMRAAYFGRLKIVKFLIRKGADLNKKNSHGKTALMAAYNRPSIAKELIDAGADHTIVNNYGKTALNIAEEYEDPCSLMESEGDFPAHLIRKAIEAEQHEEVEQGEREGEESDQENEYGGEEGEQ